MLFGASAELGFEIRVPGVSLELVAGLGTHGLWLAGVQVGERDVLLVSPES